MVKRMKAARLPGAVLLIICMLLSFQLPSAAAEKTDVSIPEVSQINEKTTDYEFVYQLKGLDAASRAALADIADESGVYEFTIKGNGTEETSVALPSMKGDGTGEINFTKPGVYSFILMQDPDQEYPEITKTNATGKSVTTVKGCQNVYTIQLAVANKGTDSSGDDTYYLKQVVIRDVASYEKKEEILFENVIKEIHTQGWDSDAGDYLLTYESNGGTEYDPETYDEGEDAAPSINENNPIREGFLFEGWFEDEELTDPVDEEEIMDSDKTVYAKWKEVELEKDDHFAYIIGYPDGTVQPTGKITRAEVATIFFRLLTDEIRTQLWKTDNEFTDVQKADWFNNAISTLAGAGIVNGYLDGSFLPNNPITRGEFATIAARFDQSDPDTSGSKLTDIKGHWAEEYIKKAEALGYVTGYEDGSFKPNQYITRAEAMTLINRVLDRDTITLDGLHEDMVEWSDNMDTSRWYYLAVQEATNSHNYTMAPEKWSSMRENRDWAALEKETSEANSSENTGDVMKNSLVSTVLTALTGVAYKLLSALF